MSMPQEKVSELNKNQPKVNIGIVSGRIFHIRRFTTQQGTMFEHVLILPAPDQFSSPQTISLNSVSRLGEKGEDITVKVSIGGFRNTFKAENRETGEMETRVTANNRLQVID